MAYERETHTGYHHGKPTTDGPIGTKEAYDQTVEDHDVRIDNVLNFASKILWSNIKGNNKVFVGVENLDIEEALKKFKEVPNKNRCVNLIVKRLKEEGLTIEKVLKKLEDGEKSLKKQIQDIEKLSDDAKTKNRNKTKLQEKAKYALEIIKGFRKFFEYFNKVVNNETGITL